MTSAREKPSAQSPEFWDGLYRNGKQFTEADPADVDVWLSRAAEHLGCPPKTAIELGCGTGQLTVLAAEKGLQITGLDMSQVALDKARERLAARPELAPLTGFRRLDFNEVDGKGEAPNVDIAFMKLTYSFVVDRTKFLRHVWNSLVDRGCFVLMTPVIGENRTYSEFARFISAPEHETQDLIAQTFATVEVLDRKDWGDDGVDMTYLLAK